jgi:hypothetical protein
MLKNRFKNRYPVSGIRRLKDRRQRAEAGKLGSWKAGMLKNQPRNPFNIPCALSTLLNISQKSSEANLTGMPCSVYPPPLTFQYPASGIQYPVSSQCGIRSDRHSTPLSLQEVDHYQLIIPSFLTRPAGFHASQLSSLFPFSFILLPLSFATQSTRKGCPILNHPRQNQLADHAAGFKFPMCPAQIFGGQQSIIFRHGGLQQPLIEHPAGLV